MEPHHHQQLQRFNYEFWFFAFGLKRHEARGELLQQPRSPCQRRAAFSIAKPPCAAVDQKGRYAVSPLAPNDPTRLAVDAKRLIGNELGLNRHISSAIGKARDAGSQSIASTVSPIPPRIA